MDVFGGLEFEDAQVAVAVDGEEVEGTALAVKAAEGLAEDSVREKVCVDVLDLAADLRFEPALGFVQVKGVVAVCCLGMPVFANLFDKGFDGGDFFGAGFAFSTEAVFDGGFLVAAGLAQAGDL